MEYIYSMNQYNSNSPDYMINYLFLESIHIYFYIHHHFQCNLYDQSKEYCFKSSDSYFLMFRKWLREKFYPEKSSTPRKSLPRKKSTILIQSSWYWRNLKHSQDEYFHQVS